MKQAPARQSKTQSVKVTDSHRFRMEFVALIAACFYLSGCDRSAMVEAPPPAQPAAAEQPRQASNLPLPALFEVQEAVKRVFKDSAVIDTSRKPTFLAGDFNGDLSQDIAVILKPAAGKLPEMNEEFPTWILKDPFVQDQPGMQRLRVTENEMLLAVVHGYGVNGWRDPQATQTYLLKNVVGSKMEAHPQKEFVTANRGKKVPSLQGDLISEVLKGAPGYLYYSGATYSWYDPKTFKGEPERRLVHGGARRN